MKIEHDELHADLVKATQAGGRTAEAAKQVAKVLHNHFVKEEEYAMPPVAYGAERTSTLPAGDYAVVVTLNDGAGTREAAATIAAGERTELTVE